MKEAKAMNFNTALLNQDDNPNYGKAKRKISRWANKPDGIPHKIIKAYFLSEIEGSAEISDIKKLCCDDVGPLRIGDEKKFDVNFSQLKYDSDKSHGHIFDVLGTKVTLWEEVEPEMMYYKNQFIKK